MPRQTLSIFVYLLFLCLVSGSAAAQTAVIAAGPGHDQSASTWSAEAGYESLRMRDVASTMRPIDASPVSWTGDGPALAVRYDRASTRRLHRFELSFSTSGHFAYDAVVRTRARPSSDRASRSAGSYEYRRYLLRNLLIDGFDVGVGAHLFGEYFSFARHLDASITIDEHEAHAGFGLVASARVHRWTWFDAELAWRNGAFLNRNGERHSVDSRASYDTSGGGWSTDLLAAASIRLSGRTSVLASYLHNAQARYASHDTSSFGRSRFLVGLRYAK